MSRDTGSFYPLSSSDTRVKVTVKSSVPEEPRLENSGRPVMRAFPVSGGFSSAQAARSSSITKISRITRKSVRTGTTLPDTWTVVGKENMILSFHQTEQMV